MLDNFEETKKQLNELSVVLNKFKSEAVQLKLLDLLFIGPSSSHAEPSPTQPLQGGGSKKTKSKRKPKKTAQTEPKKSGKRASGQGAVATLGKLVDEGFFSKHKTIADIVEHCDHNLARKFKANEFSGKLGRLVREGTLSRRKNSDNQYEYQS